MTLLRSLTLPIALALALVASVFIQVENAEYAAAVQQQQATATAIAYQGNYRITLEELPTPTPLPTREPIDVGIHVDSDGVVTIQGGANPYWAGTRLEGEALANVDPAVPIVWTALPAGAGQPAPIYLAPLDNGRELWIVGNVPGIYDVEGTCPANPTPCLFYVRFVVPTPVPPL